MHICNVRTTANIHSVGAYPVLLVIRDAQGAYVKPQVCATRLLHSAGLCATVVWCACAGLLHVISTHSSRAAAHDAGW
jgi:hypothetical protein